MEATVLIVMGVSGAGKTTLARALAATLGWHFQEGDDLHPPENIRTMREGRPLTDADRAPWLAAIKAWTRAELRAGSSGLITCSALKRSYRDALVAGDAHIRLLYLEVPADTLAARLVARRAHFMPPSLLGSQLAALERPTPDERPIIVPAAATPDATLARALRQLRDAGVV